MQIDDLIDKYKERRERNQYYSRVYQCMHYSVGYPQLVCTSILGFLQVSGSQYTWRTWVGLLATLLSASMIFFNMQDKATRFRDTKLQYNDLIKDLQECKVVGTDEKDLIADIIEKEKMIAAYEQSPSMCLDYFN